MKIKITIPPDSDRIHVHAPFEFKDELKAISGARWDQFDRAWTYPASVTKAGELWQHVGANPLDTDSHFRALLEEARDELDAARYKIAGDDVLPEIPGRVPAWLHQKRAYHWAIARRGSMLAMDMGTGKSRTAISLLDGWNTQACVIVAPRSVVNVWPNQFAIHSERDWHAVPAPMKKSVPQRVVYLTKQVTLALAKGQPIAVILNYESAWREPMDKFVKDMLSIDGCVLILDESHRIKSPGAKASKFLTRVGREASRRLLLTGTPMPHSPLDIYAQYRVMDPTIFGTSFTVFRNRYAILKALETQGRSVQVVAGYQNQMELTQKFGDGSFVVRKEDAGLDLPDVLDEEKVVEISPAARKSYEQLAEQFIIEVGEEVVTAGNALVKLLRLQQITSGYLRDDAGGDHVIDDAKIKALAEIFQDLDPTEPRVVFCRFQHDLKTIEALCDGLGLRYGEVSGRVHPGKANYGLNEHSQMREDLDVVALQIQSGGVGIDLTRAAYAIYYSLGFSLGDYLQSRARLDRPGQTRPVTYFHLIAQGTVDRAVYRALKARQEVVDAIINQAHTGRIDTEE